jgi:hypothetical protein
MKVARLSDLRIGCHYPREIFLSRSHAHSAARGIMSLKNSIDIIGNRTLDLLACSAMPQPTAPPRVLDIEVRCNTLRKEWRLADEELSCRLEVSETQCSNKSLKVDRSFETTYQRKYIGLCNMLDPSEADTYRPWKTWAHAADELRCAVFTSYTRRQRVERSGFKFTQPPRKKWMFILLLRKFFNVFVRANKPQILPPNLFHAIFMRRLLTIDIQLWGDSH